MPYKDPEVKKAYQKKYHLKWYKKNKEKRYSQIKDRQKSIREKFYAYKALLSCKICGEKESVALDFHHLRNKENIVSRMISDGFGWNSIQKEIGKCIVLCSNCHRIEHYNLNNKESE